VTALPADGPVPVAAEPRGVIEGAFGLLALSVEMAGHGMVIDVLPGSGHLPFEPDPGMAFGTGGWLRRAHAQAHRGDLRPVVDVGLVHPGISCAARCGSRRTTPLRSG
jgi:hypothetical protein